MREKIKTNLIPRLIEAHITWHTRKGLRSTCLCNYCLEKRVGTAFIGRTFTPWWRWDGIKETLVPWYKEMSYEEVGEYLTKWERERKREIVRERLKNAKEEIL